MNPDTLDFLNEVVEVNLDELVGQYEEAERLGSINDNFEAVCTQLGEVCQLEERMEESGVVCGAVAHSINNLKLVLRGKAIEQMDRYYNIK